MSLYKKFLTRFLKMVSFQKYGMKATFHSSIRKGTNPIHQITANLGKLFNKILLARIMTFINAYKLIHNNQIGFKENQEQRIIFLH